MAICEICGNDFEERKAENTFNSNVDRYMRASYQRLNRTLCGECAILEYECGNYFEACENCGRGFYPETEYLRFQEFVSHRAVDADMYEHGIHCADCAVGILQRYLDEFLGF